MPLNRFFKKLNFENYYNIDQYIYKILSIEHCKYLYCNIEIVIILKIQSHL